VAVSYIGGRNRNTRRKPPKDVMAVMKYICNIQKIPQERHTFILQQFANIDGNELVKMQKHEFREKVPMEGDMIFHVLKTMFNIN
jgi:uncharacterized sporulation protein YeaH/YhbH (DUF444 family)